MTETRGGSLAGRLTRAGVEDVPRAERLIADEALVALVPDAAETLVGSLADVGDPDAALLTLAKLAGAVRTQPLLAALLRDVLAEDGPARKRLLAVAGASVSLGDTLAAHPENLRVLVDDEPGVGVPVAVVRAE